MTIARVAEELEREREREKQFDAYGIACCIDTIYERKVNS